MRRGKGNHQKMANLKDLKKQEKPPRRTRSDTPTSLFTR